VQEKPIALAPAVARVAHNRIAGGSQMRPNLMSRPLGDAAADQGQAGERPHRRDGRAAQGIGRFPGKHPGGGPVGHVEFPGRRKRRPDPAVDHGQIGLGHLSGILQPSIGCSRFRGKGHRHQPRGQVVQAGKKQRRSVGKKRRQQVFQTVAAGRAEAGAEKPPGLDQGGIVRPGRQDRDVRRRKKRCRPGQGSDCDHVPRPDLVGRPPPPAVDRRAARRDTPPPAAKPQLRP